MLRKLGIVTICVRNWQGAVRWYSETLGLKLLYREDDHRWCQFGFPEGGANLALYGTDIEDGGRNRCVPNILVSDLDGVVQVLGRHGVQPLRIQDHADEGYRLVTIADPEGNEIQLYEVVPGAA